MRRIGLFIAIIIFISSCSSEYERLVEREMSSGMRYDSLFLGLRFGMERQLFFDLMLDLNRDKKIWQGKLASSITYPVSDLKYEGDMLFFPTFHDERIYEMNCIFSYKSWAPWNKRYSADSLRYDVLNVMKKWYGDEFIKMEADNGNFAHIKVDGNRRIMIIKQEERNVKVVFTDLVKMEELREVGELEELQKQSSI